MDELSAEAARRELHIDAAVGNAMDLDLPDRSVDAVLLLGPLYRLTRPGDRLRALRETRRVVRSGGPVFVAAISRWAPRLQGEVVERLYQQFPDLGDETARVERAGRMPPLLSGSFAGYCHRPRQLAGEIRRAGLELLDLVTVEGIAFALLDLEDRLATAAGR